MKCSIRDLLLVTVIVALAVAWWVDRSRLAQVIEIQNVELEATRAQEAAARAPAEAHAQAAAAVQSALHSLPGSSAPAPSPPNDSAATPLRP